MRRCLAFNGKREEEAGNEAAAAAAVPFLSTMASPVASFPSDGGKENPSTEEERQFKLQAAHS